jgi:hypothetical protein
MATNVSVIGQRGRRSDASLHWAKRPLPEPPRTRRVSKWTRVRFDRLQGELEDWLKDITVGYTHDAD